MKKNQLTHMTEQAVEKINDMTINFMEKSVSNYFTGIEEVMKTMGLNHFFLNRMFDGGIIPAVNSLLEMEKDLTDSLIQAFYGEKEWPEYVQEMTNRISAGTRYDQLVQTLGKEIFGTASYEGEKLLAENEYYKLYYIPAKKGTTQEKAAFFHAGGVLPYSDKLFRFLPETNFFDRFIERGIPVYSMEQKGTKDNTENYGGLTIEKHVDTINEFSDIAFKHNKNNKLILEGYCGLGMQAMAFPMALPKEAEKKFKVISTFVSPIDGSKCGTLASMMTRMPQHLLLTKFTIANLTGGYVSGDSLRRTQDIALKGFFPKTSFGRFVTGWKNKEYANVKSVDDLNAKQRADLAGAYWISPQNCSLYPVPVNLAQYSTRVFVEGVKDNGDVAFTYKGKKLSFNTPLKETSLEFVGFYGARDRLVPDKTAEVLKKIFGKRYTHVVHEKAGHISYVLSPNVWDKKNAKALKPNPIDTLLELYNR